MLIAKKLEGSMKGILTLICACLCLTQGMDAAYSFTISPRTNFFSTTYDIFSEDDYCNSIENHYFQFRTVYSLFNEEGALATGTARLLSMGTFLGSMREIDVHDAHGNYLGSIEGHWTTEVAGKFSFTDEYQFLYATAYVDLSRDRVIIVDAYDEELPIASFKRYLSRSGGAPYWKVKVVDEAVIDYRIVEIFAAFITDYCASSVATPVEEIEEEILIEIVEERF